jgi:hypothetical protein
MVDADYNIEVHGVRVIAPHVSQLDKDLACMGELQLPLGPGCIKQAVL